jgi:hypothetical protein
MRPQAFITPVLSVIAIGILITGIVVWRQRQQPAEPRRHSDPLAVPATMLPKPKPDAQVLPSATAKPAEITVPPGTAVDARAGTAATAGLELFADKRAPVEQRLAQVTQGHVLTAGSAEAQAVLVRVLSDREEHPSIRNEAANMLTGSTSALLVEQLIRILADKQDSERFRAYAVQHLANLGMTATFMEAPALAARCRNAIVSVRRDPQREVQREAWLALCQVEEPEALADIVAVLADPDSGRCDIAIRVVEERDDRAHAPALRKLAAVGDLPTRVQALRVLGLWRDPEATRLATAALSDASPIIRSAAKDALTTMGVLPDLSAPPVAPETGAKSGIEEAPEQTP